ncbi:YraN family protein [Pseudomonadota bacterium]
MRQKGYLGEEIAAKFMVQKGYFVISRNFTIQGGEIDLIVKKDGILVFVEVKAFWGDYFGPPEQAVTNRKKRILLRAIYTYMKSYPERFIDWRCDLVSIEFISTKKAKIKHFHNIFLR